MGVLVIGIIILFTMIGVIVAVTKQHNSFDDSNHRNNVNYSKDYMNNPVVRDMQERNRNL